MHIRDEEFHPDLQSQVPGLRRMARLMKIPGFIRLVDWVRRKDGKGYRGTRMLYGQHCQQSRRIHHPNANLSVSI